MENFSINTVCFFYADILQLHFTNLKLLQIGQTYLKSEAVSRGVPAPPCQNRSIAKRKNVLSLILMEIQKRKNRQMLCKSQAFWMVCISEIIEDRIFFCN